ncbi:Calcyphosin-like protein [Tritrichomonas foetus]|uniref:Calcyphosin-like protein n=1 Tax=Tritrichomonas foetus TaxID=1144522 RepID=A0A1J4KRI9_9EUKA|nr:Calcyphosin-like protein [Tritrichomonas foetus]|eukprot:OHT13879.1 Calcyphosin-like protein [Tritrichomonas foetus]
MSWMITQQRNDEELDALMGQIREQIVKHGGGGIASLGRKFRIADDNRDYRIDLKEELPKVLRELKINISAENLKKVQTLLDRDRNGSIDYEEFLYHLAPPMNALRVEWVNKVFDKLDKDRSGKIKKDDLAKAQNADARYNNLCRLCDKRGDGVIDREELIDYYREISPSIDSDEYFVTMLTNAWKL